MKKLGYAVLSSAGDHFGAGVGFPAAVGGEFFVVGTDLASMPGEGAFGAVGAAWPRLTEIPNKRHCPLTGAYRRSKLTCVGTEGKNPAIRNMPLGSICGKTVN
ncbi:MULTISPECIES: hypothetical protein [Bradyrhizobium]|jgi:hypothetical protein|uniref:hypothetical protein n=1 Tax=Bradyrhizobium TaxID=374 RepID=UPI0012FD0098